MIATLKVGGGLGSKGIGPFRFQRLVSGNAIGDPMVRYRRAMREAWLENLAALSDGEDR